MLAFDEKLNLETKYEITKIIEDVKVIKGRLQNVNV